MKRGQRRMLVVSLFLILVLGLALGCFLRLEEKEEEEALAQHEAAGAGEPGADMPMEEEYPEEMPGADPEGSSGEGQTSESGPEGAKEPQNQEKTPITLFFTGDIMLDQSNVKANYDEQGITGILSESLLSQMQQADVTVVNQEFPFSTRGTPASDKQYTFRADPSYVSVFQDMGVDVASLANNHALDFGTEALSDTFVTLDEAGISYVGAGETKERAASPVYLERGGRTIGVLAASRVIPVVSWNIENQQPGMLCTYDSAQLVAAIRETKEHCDYVAVFVHWGIERQNTPEEYQRQLAKEYIDAGADLVVGSHPHVPQGIEYYNGKPIVYSLGNFIFNKSNADTYALKVELTPEDTLELTAIPVRATEAKTEELTGQEGQALLEMLQGISYGVAIDGEGKVHPAQ